MEGGRGMEEKERERGRKRDGRREEGVRKGRGREGEGDGLVETEGTEGERVVGRDWASSLFVILCPHIVLVVFVVWAGHCVRVPCPRCHIVVVGVVGATSLVGCPFVLVLWCHGALVVRCSW